MQPAASDIHVTPDGKFLYGAERKTSMLASAADNPCIISGLEHPDDKPRRSG